MAIRIVRVVATIFMVAFFIMAMERSASAQAGATAGGAGNESGVVRGEVVSVGIGGVNGQGGLYRTGCWVPMQVRLQNRSGKQFVGRLAVEQNDLDGDKILSIGPKFILQPTDVDGRLLWAYYWPKPDDLDLTGEHKVVVMDESGTQALATIWTPDKRPGGAGLARADADSYRSERFVLLMGSKSMGFQSFLKSWGGTEGVRFAWIQNANQIPDDVKGLDGVDVIVWQADSLRVSDIPPDFQLKAILDWCRAGGHLIISVGTQGQEFLKAEGPLHAVMPITFTGTRSLAISSLSDASGLSKLGASAGNFVQAVGTIRADGAARPVVGSTGGAFASNPLAVTGLCGRGAITVLTFDAGMPELDARLDEHDWIAFWDMVAGWQQGSSIKTSADIDAARQRGNADPVTLPPRNIRLGDSLPSEVDVSQETRTFILTAVLFLAVYWLLAGPVGHIILRYYKIVHWSWWIFGGVVVVATTLAGLVVFLLHITTYELRHKTFILGTVNDPQVTALGFYGVYAPASGEIPVQQPESSGVNYLAPMCFPSSEEVKPFADPQEYKLWAEHSNSVSPVFRNTLKKLQGRWTGDLQTLTGQATATGVVEHPLTGELVNHSAYDLDDVQLVLFRTTGVRGNSLLYTLNGTWKAGASIDLSKALTQDKLEGLQVEAYLQVMGWAKGRDALGGPLSGNGVPDGATPAEKALFRRFGPDTSDDLLYFLLDQRNVDSLVDGPGGKHSEPVRGIGRWTDATKELHAAGALIVARAGNIKTQHFVLNPVALLVNGREIAGKGEIDFAWALPVIQQARQGVPGGVAATRDETGVAGAGAGGRAGATSRQNPNQPLIPRPEAQ